jgi:hypothetical protein
MPKMLYYSNRSRNRASLQSRTVHDMRGRMANSPKSDPIRRIRY